MGTGDLSISDYDPYAGAYLASVTRREQGEAGDSYGILPHLLRVRAENDPPGGWPLSPLYLLAFARMWTNYRFYP